MVDESNDQRDDKCVAISRACSGQNCAENIDQIRGSTRLQYWHRGQSLRHTERGLRVSRTFFNSPYDLHAESVIFKLSFLHEIPIFSKNTYILMSINFLDFYRYNLHKSL